jgi:hypothetical protein
MAEFAKPRVIGFNHVALEVGDIDEALAYCVACSFAISVSDIGG